MYSIINSSFLKFYNKKTYYEDFSKYANLGIWILNGIGGAEIETIEELIGEYPNIDDDTERSLNEADLEMIELAKELNLNYKITSNGIKLMK